MSELRESLARLEERERARALLLDERFDRQDETLARIERAVTEGETERRSMSLRVTGLERDRDRAKAWIAGAMAVGGAVGALAAWLISLVK